MLKKVLNNLGLKIDPDYEKEIQPLLSLLEKLNNNPDDNGD